MYELTDKIKKMRAMRRSFAFFELLPAGKLGLHAERSDGSAWITNRLAGAASIS
ncbi:hypothetical protein [Paenibacillus donghaensis]|uniref:hypothetical protein n=1 Tax=Paenibacillus donghaensis TaxID=414771 RepID=UPI0012FC63DF|nr:hypothetical protein [Paenibacillus donghaensis]